MHIITQGMFAYNGESHKPIDRVTTGFPLRPTSANVILLLLSMNKFTCLRDADISDFVTTCRDLATGDQEYLHSTINNSVFTQRV